MSFSPYQSLQPNGTVYEFTESELNELVNAFIQDYIGCRLNVWVATGEEFGMESEPFVLAWDYSDAVYSQLTEWKNDKIDELPLYCECEDDNRNNVLSRLF